MNEDQLKIMNSVLRNLLGLWFSTGLLNIERVDWNSPASLGESDYSLKLFLVCQDLNI